MKYADNMDMHSKNFNMNKCPLYLALLCSTLHIELSAAAASAAASPASDKLLEHQKYLGNMGVALDQNSYTYKAHRRNVKDVGQQLLQEARKNPAGISPQDYKFLKGTSAQAAASADYAHEQGLFGNNITILLLEDSGITHSDVRTYVEPGSPKDPIRDFHSHTDHGSAMAAYIHAVAPGATIRTRTIAILEYQSGIGERIINASFGDDKPQGFMNTFGVSQGNALIVKSAGNSKEDLSTTPYTQNCDSLIPRTIFAGNLRQDYKGKTSSGVPGLEKKFQDSFLWVIADHVLTASGPEDSIEYSPKTGTSGATAILSGAAALILSKYPELTTAELKDILLESADRDIFQLFGSGYNAVHIVENPGVVKDAALKPNPKLPTAQYNPTFWGKGVLNIKNALLYADLYVNLKKSVSSDPKLMLQAVLRQNMLQILHNERKIAATKIQARFKDYKARLGPLDQSQLNTRQSLTINTDLPARQFTEAPGSHSSAPIPEQTDAERLAAYGVAFPASDRKLKIIGGSKPSATSTGAGSVRPADETSEEATAAPVAAAIPKKDPEVAKIEKLIGAEWNLSCYILSAFLQSPTTTPVQKEQIKAFFKTPVGVQYCADIAVSRLQEAAFLKLGDIPGHDYQTRIDMAIQQVLGDIKANAPDFYAFIKEYALEVPSLREKFIEVNYADIQGIQQIAADEYAKLLAQG